MSRFMIAVLLVLVGACGASARTLTVATWNLGWHMDIQTAERWISECGKTYAPNATADQWLPSSAPDAKPGWDVPNTFAIQNWDAANLPVCDVYFDRGTVRVTPEAYRKRQQQIACFIRR